VEFQLRREVLRELGVECFDDLHVRANGIWRYLTDEWLSLRVKDNPNVSRRSVHPVWAILQAAATNFGPALEVERKYRKGGTAAAEWYVSHGAGCLAGFAVREGIDDFESALGLFAAKMREYWQTRSFADRFEVERIKLGFDDTAGGT
jgi:hypothetical protein